MKNLTCLSLVLLILLSMPGCSRNQSKTMKNLDAEHVAVIENDLDVFSSGDISAITENVFEISPNEVTTDGAENGIIADLFANADVQVSSADETTITYTIVSPDISDFFSVMADDLQAITTTEELRDALIEYAQTAPEREFTVILDYSTSDTGIKIEYDNPEFINAMTGGLLDAYADLYNYYLEEEG